MHYGGIMMLTIARVKARLKVHSRHLFYFFKWLLLAVLTGGVTGCVGTAFWHCLTFATQVRTEYPVLLLGLPVGGLFIVWIYHICGRDNDRGTNMVLSAVREQDSVPVRVTALIFASTIITHLFGGSAGREGAALQLGGWLGARAGDIFKLDETDRRTAIMCGMAAVFSALFGTPVAAAVFCIEVISVGVFHYEALVPCFFSAYISD